MVLPFQSRLVGVGPDPDELSTFPSLLPPPRAIDVSLLRSPRSPAVAIGVGMNCALLSIVARPVPSLQPGLPGRGFA
ncbi:MAG TPA: hypothetical protein VIL45_07170 [Thermoplasmata archaeon]